MSWSVEIDGKKRPARVARAKETVTVTLGDTPIALELLQSGRAFSFLRDGRQVEVAILRRTDAAVELLVDGVFHALSVTDDKRASSSATALASHGEVKAVMPGRVVKLHVREGDAVEKGAPLLVLEAMKMENEIKSPAAGTVQKILVTPGQTVETGAALISIGTSNG